MAYRVCEAEDAVVQLSLRTVAPELRRNCGLCAKLGGTLSKTLTFHWLSNIVSRGDMNTYAIKMGKGKAVVVRLSLCTTTPELLLV